MLKRGLFAALRHSGVAGLYRRIMQRKKATIILFHEMNHEQSQVVYSALYKYYNFISLENLVAAIESNSWEQIPNYALVVTLDDGRRSNLSASAFAENGVEAINFVSSSPDRLDGQKFVTESELSELGKLFDIQSHTHSHPNLSQLSKTMQLEEIRKNIDFLHSRKAGMIKYVAFPYGQYNQDSVDACKELGVRASLTVDSGFVDADSDLYRLKRLCLPNSFSESELLVKVSGLWNFLQRKH
ncbi:polysaccharide deacetylase [Kangiella koreensis DSM 16069]|uniref:Polysaccharide deacetylase n=2 Tax=Kangiella TaxID=261963 RepID=C7RAQ3_KANKD|nr:polysaccharide deacetylase [Kangiella koreensis DSM 16069]